MKLRSFLTEEQSIDKDFKGGKQKDWIVYDEGMKNLFCIAIVDRGDGWKLEEFVNFIGMEHSEHLKMMQMGYDTMLQAAIGRDEYEYVIAKHKFEKKDVDTDYWHGLVTDKDKFWGKVSMNAPIDKDEFEKEMGKLV
jgi:hypothetical protein